MTDHPDETVPDTEPAEVPEDGPEAPTGRKGAFIGLAVVAAVVALGVAALVFFVLDADGPSDVVDDYFQALKDADLEGARGYMCEAERGSPSPDDAEAQAALAGLVADFEWEVVDEKINDAETEATVTVEIGGLGEAAQDTVRLVAESGDWKVCGNTP
ncbi:Rv0361 family membrane protein [Phytomonospora endophytica]|uniref:DUF4878 domain-containing protein n=1 Tax=Phytomonospora endophytica TaxID=714109 RepID=A0A841FBY5_9ACTN|nr:DUF4878 domain-containing protein [Phytomonospora endophytica]MBB6034801.1 hypothetical protein [Phytomonospora endophytica]GIG68996.1 hypothetical protein Pen01_52910 [Phytomonospora endophytica]